MRFCLGYIIVVHFNF